MNDREVIAAFLQKYRPEFYVMGNVPLFDGASRPLTVNSLLSAVNQIEHKLLVAPVYQSAWDAFVLYNEDKSSIAHRRQFFEAMRHKEIQSEEKREYNELMKELGREDLRGIPLQDLREIAATQRENLRRLSLSGRQLHELCKQENPLPQRGALPETW